MATYKVPQDVEAEDKLLGPFTFRQFLYLIVVAACILIAWGLAQLFIGLAIIPLPFILFFGALALPLRKDQPMEIYLAAIVSFYLKPRQRLWDPDGIESLIEITEPKVVEIKRAKDLSQNEAAQRLNYLADIVDSQGWAIRGVSGGAGSMNSDVYLEAQGAEDVLDTNTSIAQNFDQMMSQSTERLREEAKQRMMQATATPQPEAQLPPAQPQPQTQAPFQQPYQPQTQVLQQQAWPQQPAMATAYAPVTTPMQAPTAAATVAPVAPVVPTNPAMPATPVEAPHFDPYPTFHQAVIQPIGNENHAVVDTPVQPVPMSTATADEALAQALAVANSHEKPTTTSETIPTADIINLANNADLSIETIAHEANRLKKKAKGESDEVVISLR